MPPRRDWASCGQDLVGAGLALPFARLTDTRAGQALPLHAPTHHPVPPAVTVNPFRDTPSIPRLPSRPPGVFVAVQVIVLAQVLAVGAGGEEEEPVLRRRADP